MKTQFWKGSISGNSHARLWVRDATAMPNEPSLQVRIENGANVADRCVLLPVIHNFFSGFFSISHDFCNFAVTDKAGKLRAHFGLIHTRCSRRFCSADSKVLNLK